MLHAAASGNPVDAAEATVRMLDRVDCNPIRENVNRLLRAKNHELNADGVTTDGLLVEFVLRHHDTKGQPSTDAQNATDAVLAAACFALPADDEAPSASFLRGSLASPMPPLC